MSDEVSRFFSLVKKKIAITYITYRFFFVPLRKKIEVEVMTCASMGGQLPPTSLT